MKRSAESVAKVLSNLEFILTVIVGTILLVLLALESLLDLLTFEVTLKIVLAAIVSFFMMNSLVQRYNIVPLIQSIKRLQSIEKFDILESYEAYYLQLLRAIERARDVKLIYITEHPPAHYRQSAIDYWNKISRILETKENIFVQRIASLDNAAKQQWVRENTEQLKNIEGYAIKCFVPHDKLKPIGIEIIDQEDVFLFGPHGIDRGVHIKNKALGTIMVSYFNAVWDSLGEDAYLKKHGEKKPNIEARIKKLLKRA